MWLTQDQLSLLFNKAKTTISEHISNIFKEGELDESVVVRKFRITTPHGAIEGKTQAIRHRPMYMEDYIKQLDGILSGTGEQILLDAGSVSHQQAMEKAEKECRKYQVKTLSPVEQAYLDTIKQLEKEAKENSKIDNN